MTCPTTDKEEKERNKLKKFTAFFTEAIAVFFWSFIIIKAVIFDLDVYFFDKFAPSLRWTLNYRFFGLLFLAIIALFILGRKGGRKFLALIVFYPFIVVLWKIPKLLFRNWAISIAFLPAVYELISSFRLIFVLTSAALISAFLISISINPFVLGVSMSLLGVFLSVHLYRNLRRAYKTSVFAGLTTLVKKFRSVVESDSKGESLWKKVEYDPVTQVNKSDYQQQLFSFYFISIGIDFLANKLLEVAKSRKPDLYLMLSLLGVIVITTVVYAFEYLGLYKIDPGNFRADHLLGFWDFLGYSIGRIGPSSISLIQPISVIAAVISYSEICCAMLIGMIFIFSFLTAARERYKEDIAEFIREMHALNSSAESSFMKLYNMALDDVELFLMIDNAQVVNWTRKTRGLPGLPTDIKKE